MINLNTIQGRSDINLLVNRFYGKIRKDNLLGPIFNRHIAEEQWPAHLDKLTDFWETNLYGVQKFKGDPTSKHINVDTNLDHAIDQSHFDRWLGLWFETVDEMFSGELAEKAKAAASRMAKAQLAMILSFRPQD